MTDQPRRGLPIIGPLSPLSAAFLVGTVVLSRAAIVLDLGIKDAHSLLFVGSAWACRGFEWGVGLSAAPLGIESRATKFSSAIRARVRSACRREGATAR